MGKFRWMVFSALVTALLFSCFSKSPGKALPPAFSEPVERETAAPTEQAPEPVAWPCVLRGTGLVLRSPVEYEGPNLEEGTEIPVSGVMALLVYNPGMTAIRRAEILLTQGARELRFVITFLPAGSAVLVLEQGMQFYSREPVTACRCVELLEEETPPGDALAVTEDEKGITLENRSDRTLTELRVYYKPFEKEAGFFLGGYARCHMPDSLLPGERVTLTPPDYAPGLCRVVGAQWEYGKQEIFQGLPHEAVPFFFAPYEKTGHFPHSVGAAVDGGFAPSEGPKK